MPPREKKEKPAKKDKEKAEEKAQVIKDYLGLRWDIARSSNIGYQDLDWQRKWR